MAKAKKIKVTKCTKCPFFNDGAGYEYPVICSAGAWDSLDYPPNDGVHDNCPLKTKPITVTL